MILDREALAEVLWRKAQHGKHVSQKPLSEQTPYCREMFGLVADECIRQMEWARCELAKRIDGGRSNPIVTPSLSNLPLSIAPDDWKPEETR